MEAKKVKFLDGAYDEFFLGENSDLHLNYSDFKLDLHSDFECKLIIMRPSDLPF